MSIHHITVRDGNSLCSSPPCRFLSGELAAELLHFQLIMTHTCQRLYAPRRLMFVKKRDGGNKSSVITVPSGFIYFSCWITVRLLILVTLPVAGSVWAWHPKCAIRINPPPLEGQRSRWPTSCFCVCFTSVQLCPLVSASSPRPTWTSVFIYLNYDYV